MKPIHDRMPVIISSENFEVWLVSGEESLLTPYTDPMDCHPAGSFASNPGNDGKDLIDSASV
jgi:putative SOS response-associated peptidase YedK